MFGAVTEKEKRENEALKNCIQEAYGLSDEQLLAELEELEATLSDDEFVGAEERIYNKIKEREAERSSDSSEETTIASEISTSNSNPVPIRKIGKKKRWLVVGIAAALVVGAGVNTIGGNHYFLRRDESKESIVLDSGKNIIATGNLQDVYESVECLWGVPVLKLNYIPLNVYFEQAEILNNQVTFVFSFGEEKLYCIQSREAKGISTGMNSDREKKGEKIHNDWLSNDFELIENDLGNGSIEYSALVYLDDISCRIIGKLSKEELVKMVKRISLD